MTSTIYVSSRPFELPSRMGHTYGESWAFFYDNASTPRAKWHQTHLNTAERASESQYISATRVTRPQVEEQIEPSNITILAEIRKLHQELDETRRSQYQRPEIIPERSLHTPQQPSVPSASSLDPNNQGAAEPPRCWDPCCNGRAFSNNSNLARHQREKRQGESKLKCSFCGAGFSRNSARNAHEAERRCREVCGDAIG